MKLFITVLLVAAASAGHLGNNYLPPSNAKLAGGSASILAAPSVGLSTPAAISTVYATPASALAPAIATSGLVASPAPIVSYGVPVAAVKTYLAPVTPPVPIVKLNSDSNGDGSYRYDYETANHIAAQESGHLTPAGSSEVHGAFSYLAPNGQTVSVSYVADENGFRPEGSHLPTSPPIPEAILKSLEINAAEEARAAASHSQYSAASVEIPAAPVASNQYLPPTAAVQQGGYKY
ncbi:pupal cuticle protein 20-like [Anoplophora glabripennis]|uniref:pupal cuticle protein 20-like n=1 Tax=Anoplophora glabripennis TaxID=217634 RepID=UPI000874084A|nr:pupal cuticle protein 20-like [Anoplophora glabripennis]